MPGPPRTFIFCNRVIVTGSSVGVAVGGSGVGVGEGSTVAAVSVDVVWDSPPSVADSPCVVDTAITAGVGVAVSKGVKVLARLGVLVGAINKKLNALDKEICLEGYIRPDAVSEMVEGE